MSLDDRRERLARERAMLRGRARRCARGRAAARRAAPAASSKPRRVEWRADGGPSGRALPHRRQLARVPRVLRAARVDRDVDRLPDERDLRLRLDAREDPHRARHEADRRRLGRRLERAQGGLPRVQGHAQSTRPDLLAEQWPHFEPLVEAFGYTNIRLAGYEADDVIATLAERAREQKIPVVIVTGDRDAFQLIDPEGIVKVMATSRGITETKLYDHPAVIDRYGIAPELIPDFYGLKGDTSDNIPGVPGIGDKTAATLLQTYGDLEGVLVVDRQDLGRQAQGEPDQPRRGRARSRRCSRRCSATSRSTSTSRSRPGGAPDRSKLREVFREFELRDPLRRLEEFLGAEEAAPAPEASTTVSARVREGSLADVAGLNGEELVLAVQPPAVAEGELLAIDPTWRFAVAARRRGADRACSTTRRSSSRLSASGRSSRTTPRRSGSCRPTSSTTR